MPSFPGGATIVEKRPDISLTYIWLDGTRATRHVPDIAAAVSEAQMDTLASASAGLSNAGLIRYQGVGVSKEIALNSVLIYDEAHSISDDLVVTFQKEDTLDTWQYRIPAPDAALFVGGITLKPGNDAVQGTRIVAMLNAVSAVRNVGLTSGEQWVFVSGYLSTAKAKERRAVPPVANIEEPPAGTPSDDPAETPEA
jgi:hypothetical protein